MFENLGAPQKQALLMMAAGLLTPQDKRLGKGGQFAAALSQGMQGGLLGYNQARQAKRRDELMGQEAELRRMQVADMQRGQQFNQALTSGYQPAVTPATPMDDEGNRMPSSPEGFDFSGAMKIDPVKAFALKQSMMPKPKMAFAPNGQAVDMNNLTPGNYAPPEKTPDWKDPEYIKAQQAIRAAGRPQVTTTTNVLPPREVFKDSLGLKKDFDGQPEVKGFKEVQGAWDQISTALQKPSPANDMAAATKFMKLLDPGSVVRESELMMAMQASGALDRFTNTADRILKGHKLTPEQRKDFYSAGEALFNASRDRYAQTVEQYSSIAKQYGLDDKFIQNAQPRKSSGWSIQRVD